MEELVAKGKTGAQPVVLQEEVLKRRVELTGRVRTYGQDERMHGGSFILQEDDARRLMSDDTGNE